MPGLYVCPHCDSRKVSKEDENSQYCCDDCLEFFDDPKEIFSEITSNIKKENVKMASKPKPRKCRNCGREKVIIGDGLCGGCYFSVRGYKKGTLEYDKRLADAKKRFIDPDYKVTRGKRYKKYVNESHKQGVMPMSRNKFKRKKKLFPDEVSEAKTHVKALAIKHNGGDPNSAGIIAVINMKIEYHQGMIGKLKQAKEILL